ncbi:MAG: hypothetical protein U9R08_03470 [Nanoarchaeota archaeon]|nr:hypothetical protein [Nanoarchaeota archaeon]
MTKAPLIIFDSGYVGSFIGLSKEGGIDPGYVKIKYRGLNKLLKDTVFPEPIRESNIFTWTGKTLNYPGAMQEVKIALLESEGGMFKGFIDQQKLRELEELRRENDYLKLLIAEKNLQLDESSNVESTMSRANNIIKSVKGKEPDQIQERKFKKGVMSRW